MTLKKVRRYGFLTCFQADISRKDLPEEDQQLKSDLEMLVQRLKV